MFFVTSLFLLLFSFLSFLSFYTDRRANMCSEIGADNGLPLIGVSGVVQCLLKHGTVKGNHIPLHPLKSVVLKADSASEGLMAKCMHYRRQSKSPATSGEFGRKTLIFLPEEYFDLRKRSSVFLLHGEMKPFVFFFSVRQTRGWTGNEITNDVLVNAFKAPSPHTPKSGSARFELNKLRLSWRLL